MSTVCARVRPYARTYTHTRARACARRGEFPVSAVMTATIPAVPASKTKPAQPGPSKVPPAYGHSGGCGRRSPHDALATLIYSVCVVCVVCVRVCVSVSFECVRERERESVCVCVSVSVSVRFG